MCALCEPSTGRVFIETSVICLGSMSADMYLIKAVIILEVDPIANGRYWWWQKDI